MLIGNLVKMSSPLPKYVFKHVRNIFCNFFHNSYQSFYKKSRISHSIQLGPLDYLIGGGASPPRSPTTNLPTPLLANLPVAPLISTGDPLVQS